MNIKNLFNSFEMFAVNNAPEILTGIGLSGFIGTAVLTGVASVKSYKDITTKCERENINKLSSKDIVELCWKHYIPPVVAGVFSGTCIIVGCKEYRNRNTALTTAYVLADTARREYSDKVKEMFGSEKDEEIKESIAKDKINNLDEAQVNKVCVNDGDVLCYDAWTGQLFSSNKNKLDHIANKLQRRLNREMWINWNEYAYEAGLDVVKFGNVIGWNVDDGEIAFTYSSHLTKDGRPCMYVDYDIAEVNCRKF